VSGRLALFVVALDIGDAKEAFEKELTDSLIKNLAIYKCPRRMFFLDEMPLTATGRSQCFELRKMAEEQQLSAAS